MTTFCDLVSAAALGAGATDTLTAVGTVTLRPNPGIVIGIIVNGTADTSTAAEATQFQVNVDLGELGMKEFLMQGSSNVGEGVATQSSGHAGAARIIGCRIPFDGNERIPITAGWIGPAPTAGLNVQTAILYSQPPHPPKEWFERFPYLHPGVGSDLEANAAVTATGTAITELQVPSFARHITGFGCGAAQDAAGRTAEDLVLGLDFSSTFPDFTPQQYPFIWKYPNLAGTLVGTGISLPTVTFPAWIPTNAVSGQVTPATSMVTGVTDAHSVTAEVFYTNV